MKLTRKVEIRLRKIGDAGLYDLVVRDNGISENLRVVLGPGEPFKCAYRDAEILAIALDCELYLDNEIIRKPLELDN